MKYYPVSVSCSGVHLYASINKDEDEGHNTKGAQGQCKKDRLAVRNPHTKPQFSV